jgi:hypothetical protein
LPGAARREVAHAPPVGLQLLGMGQGGAEALVVDDRSLIDRPHLVERAVGVAARNDARPDARFRAVSGARSVRL